MKCESIKYYEEYRHHQTFDDMNELNDHLRLHIDNNAELSKSTVKVLKLLSRYSCVIKGVSWMKRRTIASHVDVSEKTVSRALKSLEQAGIIKRIPTVKKSGGRGYDITIILKCPVRLSSREPAESLCESKRRTKEMQEETKNINKTYVSKEPSLNELDASFTPNTVPQDFKTACKPFFGANETYQLWQRVKVAYNRCELDSRLSELSDVIINAFKSSIFAYKRGKIRQSFRAYFYVTVERMFDDVFREEVYKLVG